MPLPKRVIEPLFVARSVYQRNELPGDLETVTNTTLTNIMRQLSSLARHSEDLFGELARETNNMADRANSLQGRIDRLSIKVTQLDSDVKEVPLKDITKKKAFKSITQFDQDIFSRATMPTAMLETYQMCDKPPPLDKLNIYRDDGKDGLKFYTDPNYFFDLWRQDILQETEKKMNDRHKQKHKPKSDTTAAGGKRQNKRVRQPTNTREKQRQIAIGHGETLMPNNVIYRTPNSIINQQHQQQDVTIYSSTDYYDGRPNRPNSIELRRSYPDGSDGYAPTSPGYQQQMSYQQLNDDSAYNSSMYGQGQQMESPYAPGTPSRGGKLRPSHPPPAPPSSGSGGTPNVSNANTPTRGRSMSTGRDVLPPPPPIPELSPPHQMGVANGGILRHPGRTSMNQRNDSPQRNDMNNHVMAQLNSQMNNININDLPPPPPVPDQYHMSPQKISTSPPNAPPPAPPMAPPPPMPNGNLSNGIGKPANIITPQSNSHAGLLKEIETGISLRKVEPQPNRVPSGGYNQGDLMREIREGIKLRKVEQLRDDIRHQKQSNLHDVASILARRVAIELTDSESDSDESDEEWMEPNETSA
ncbi:CLUMA_CG007690, isoform A [Clunio marinus]|uniref:Wiskott-Aldrich syndrome protein family member n=1 Tax=Clunio marinus TaxID=568069 RepID=A0A1J1I5H5_9DIPT|nr:CLUMA_CG007690, isoform A [Clunio marinus]